MSENSASRCNRVNSIRDSKRLRELADVLGVPVTSFQVAKELHYLHFDIDDNHWLLTLDLQGKPVVRKVGRGTDQNTAEESVSSFLIHSEESPQREALITLIERLLVAHLVA